MGDESINCTDNGGDFFEPLYMVCSICANRLAVLLGLNDSDKQGHAGLLPC